MKTYFKHIQLLILAAVVSGTLFSGNLMAQVGQMSDSALSVFSVEDLVKLRKVLAKQREDLLSAQEIIRERGVEVTEDFLELTKDDNSNQDKVLIRMAEYYIEEEDLDFERRYEQYELDYEAYEKKYDAWERKERATEPEEPPQPQRNYQKAISIYDLILRNFQESDLVDDAYYNKAFLLDEMAETDAARQIFQTVIDEYPESPYAAEAYMKMAESFFYPQPGDDTDETILKLNKAIQLYKNVLEFKESSRYDEALYKLGWSYYRLAGDDPNYYTDAIIYFLAVVQDIEKLEKLDPTGDLVRTDVKPEALQFIAASFVDPTYPKSGVANTKNFIEKLGKPQYGVTIIENMGDRYAKITQWNDAINAYSELLGMYPDYIYAPGVQKKIADAYIADEKFQQAYDERASLFESYNPRSEWYAQIEQTNSPERITALDDAYRITEEAFRTNITFLYNLAQQNELDNPTDKSGYEDFVGLCRRYLDNFPTDDNAYEINWALAFVLDTKLKRFEESFAEYIRVSNDYLETEHQFDAAVNAMHVADTLVKVRVAMGEPSPASGELTNRQIRDLSPEEKMLAEAYDNFIKLFPEHPQTPSVLASAGALYYNHRKYALAKKYYKTMVTKFPKAQQKSIGLVSLMNSYFFLGQYRDSEIVAKKILSTDGIPEDQITIARSRVGESIFKNGERLEQQGNNLEAAKEYRRVYEEAADYVEFVDASLFRSARNFEQSGEWQRAIDTYEILVAEYPESKHILDALNNIAADYKEVEDYLNVAKTNERIFNRFTGTPEAENALFNASLFYAKAEAWNDGIRTNNIYIQNYPTNPESKDLLFENAKYYLKLDDLTNANRIYLEFASLYPNDPLTIEAYYNRGEYYFDNQDFDAAKVEFNNAIQRSNQFSQAGRDPNLYYAAEANYKLGRILYTEYKDIQLSYPQSTLRAQLERKQAKLGEVEQAFTKVISLGSIRGFEAMYNIAEGYEEFADAIANQRLPENLSEEQKLVQKNQVFSASVPAYDRAVEEYKNVLLNLPTLAEKLDISMDTTQAAIEKPEVEADSSVVVQKEVVADSSSEVALKWFDRAEEKISLIQYNVAQTSSGFIDEYLLVDNPNTGVRALVFKDQVLRSLVAPQVKVTIDAHLKNIAVAKELDLDNKYVEESKRKVLLSRNVMADEYKRLFYESLDEYQAAKPILESLVEGGESATAPNGMDYYDYQDNYVMQLIFYGNQFAKIAMNQYKVTLELAQENNIRNDAKATTEERMFNFGYEAGAKLIELSRDAEKKSEDFLDQFDATQKESLQLGSTFFDDQSYELSDYSQEVYSFAYELSKEFEIENIWSQLILAELVQLDPATYLEDMPREDVLFASDATWRGTTQYEPGWNLGEYSDAVWENVSEVAVPLNITFPGFDSLQISPAAIWVKSVASGAGVGTSGNPLEIEDRVPLDSLDSVGGGNTQSITEFADSLIASEPEPDTLTAYFRKTVNFTSKPIDGWIALTGDKSYRFYLNDVYITGVDVVEPGKVEYLPFVTFEEFLRVGDNLLSISVTDFDGSPRNGLRFAMSVKVLPGEISDAVNNIRKKMEQDEVSPAKLKETTILNKNRIIE